MGVSIWGQYLWTLAMSVYYSPPVHREGRCKYECSNFCGISPLHEIAKLYGRVLIAKLYGNVLIKRRMQLNVQ